MLERKNKSGIVIRFDFALIQHSMNDILTLV